MKKKTTPPTTNQGRPDTLDVSKLNYFLSLSLSYTYTCTDFYYTNNNTIPKMQYTCKSLLSLCPLTIVKYRFTFTFQPHTVGKWTLKKREKLQINRYTEPQKRESERCTNGLKRFFPQSSSRILEIRFQTLHYHRHYVTTIGQNKIKKKIYCGNIIHFRRYDESTYFQNLPCRPRRRWTLSTEPTTTFSTSSTTVLSFSDDNFRNIYRTGIRGVESKLQKTKKPFAHNGWRSEVQVWTAVRD